MQLDLFVRGRDIMLRNDVVEALRRREPAAVEKALRVLSAEFPDDTLRTPLAELSSVLGVRRAPFASHADALRALVHMENVVVPAAKLVLGAPEASDWLVPVWRSLASEAQQLAFDADHPQAHAAPMLLRAFEWSAAETSIELIPSWRRIPTTLAWMAEARFGRARLEAAWPLLIELAWSNSGLFGKLVERLSHPGLRTLLQRFHADAELAEDAGDLGWFPAARHARSGNRAIRSLNTFHSFATTARQSMP